ncbi:hypothetical protein F66182_8169 [Fusarium sp. NRRL 66182]|nr:hypothetical protein F66182_8169 [Fusarium sp. NRRL 66182]
MSPHAYTSPTAEGDSLRNDSLELVQRVESIASAALHAFSKDQTKSTEDYQELFGGFSAEGSGPEGFTNAVELLFQHSVDNTSPGFLGKLVSAPSPPGIAADLFLSILNNNGHVWRASPALTAVEKHVSLELAKLFGLPGRHAGGISVPGGAAGNLLAMLVARNMVAPESKQQGLMPGRYSVFVSEAAHYSVSNAAQVIGLGNDAVVRVPALEDGTMDVDGLETAVHHAIQDGRRPLLIAATSGSTVNGAFDPLDKIGAIALKANAWFHVDACWGGAVVFSERLRGLIKGSELADSIAFNPHKLLGVPLVCAFLLVNDLRTLWLANKLNAGYLFHQKNSGKPATGSEDGLAQTESLSGNKGTKQDWRRSELLSDAPDVAQIKDLASLTIQCSRRSDAAKMFLHWKYYGTQGIARDVEQAVDSAQHLARIVQNHPRLELIGEPDKVFAQVCLYWKPNPDTDSSGQTMAVINSRNTQLLYRELDHHGWKIDYAPHKVKGEFLRVACNRLTTRQGVEGLVSKLIELGVSLGL